MANLLVTGPPRSGKTTVLERTRSRLADEGYDVGGVACPERRAGGDRVGFEVVDVRTGESRVLAHVDRETGPAVGKYRVAVENVAAVAGAALPAAVEACDAVLVDEVAPMQVASDAFVAACRRALDAETPVVAAVHERSTSGFAGEVKAREDATTFEVTPDSRDDLPGTLAGRVREVLA